MNVEARKTCPYCAEDIRPEAIKCRYCGSRLTGRPSVFSWTRSADWRMVGGVCAGLAKEFDISVTAIRLCFVLAFVLGFGMALPIYVILWIIMPLDLDVRDDAIDQGLELRDPRYDDRPPPR